MGTYYPVLGETAYGLPVYKKRGAEKWLQCSPGLNRWFLQSTDSRNTMHGHAQSPYFSSIYECKLPHEMTGQQWSVVLNDCQGLIDIDVDISTASTSISSKSVSVSPDHGFLLK